MGGSKNPMRIHLLESEGQINPGTDSSKLSQGRNDSQYRLGDIYWTGTTKTPRCFPKEGETLSNVCELMSLSLIAVVFGYFWQNKFLFNSSLVEKLEQGVVNVFPTIFQWCGSLSISFRVFKHEDH